MREKEKKCPPEGAPDWLNTYGDMVTLVLTFFVLLYALVPKSDPDQTRLVIAAFQGLGMFEGGNTLQSGKLSELGNTVMSLPSTDKGRALDRAKKRAISQFQPEVKSNMVRIKEDERGLIISLAADAFFAPGSAEIDIESARETLQKASALLSSLPDRKFRIEGHTDSLGTDPAGPYPTNWELSAARSTNVLHYLVDFGVDERQFQVAGFADTVPIATNDTPEGRAYNRRVDIVILTEGHL
jgi:chemotaxis protein MotB